MKELLITNIGPYYLWEPIYMTILIAVGYAFILKRMP